MIRSFDIAPHSTAIQLNRAPGEQPIESHGDGVRSLDSFAGRAVKAEALQFVEIDRREIFGIEVAAQDRGGAGGDIA